MGGERPARTPQRRARRGMVRRRRLVAAAVVVAIGGAGWVAVARHGSDRADLAERYVAAWERRDYARMHRLLSDEAQAAVSAATFARLHRDAAATATAVAVRATGAPQELDGDVVRIPVAVATRLFGTLRLTLDLPVGAADTPRVAWRPSLAFPGVRDGEQLRASLQLPERATLLTRDGHVLARGDARTPESAVADVAAQTVGELGPAPADRRVALRARGVPDGARVGLSGLERALDPRLTGRAGGVLRAGGRPLASVTPRRAPAVRTTIAPGVERAAVQGLAGRLGGAVAFDPRTGEVLAFAGIAFSALQPPGSTFKMITATGAVEAGIAKSGSRYPVQTAATLEGVELQNANAESCGGTLVESFAQSCNSVFAPLGVKLGATRLVDVAERFGFNRAPGLDGAATPTIPPAGEIGDDLAIGSSAIGQGRVQATALTMAKVAATIGLRGRMPELTLDRGVASDRGRAPTHRVTDARTARTIEKLMLAVVRAGTGTLAAIPGVKVAGKTGTAELESTQQCDAPMVPQDPAAAAPAVSEGCSKGPEDTDAWFAAYAPAGSGNPRVAVGIMLVRNGAGGDTAAPVAKQVLLAALKR
jgi:cell division protein FtsI/penicillin-binding protein 2